MSITHPFVSAKADDVDATKMRPSDWNNDHNYPPVGNLIFHTDPTINFTWTNMPAALTELGGFTLARMKYDLTNASRARLGVRISTPGLGGSELRAQYSTDESVWAYLDGASGPSLAIDANGTLIGAWATLAAAARADVFLRIVGINGDGAVDPKLNNIILEVE